MIRFETIEQKQGENKQDFDKKFTDLVNESTKKQIAVQIISYDVVNGLANIFISFKETKIKKANNLLVK